MVRKGNEAEDGVPQGFTPKKGGNFRGEREMKKKRESSHFAAVH